MNIEPGWITAAIAVFAVPYGAWQTVLHFQRVNEQASRREYLAILERLPAAWRSSTITYDELEAPEARAVDAATWDYLELVNNQIFLRRTRQISRRTWTNHWQRGIQRELSEGLFRRAEALLHTEGFSGFVEVRTWLRDNSRGEQAKTSPTDTHRGFETRVRMPPTATTGSDTVPKLKVTQVKAVKGTTNLVRN